MSEQSPPIVEVTPTVIVSNSEEEPRVVEGETVIEEEYSDAVAIAEIEANRDITIAAIHSETEQVRTEAEVNAIENRNEGIEECRREVERLTGIVEALMETVNSLTPPAPLVEEIVEEVTEELETLPELNSIQPSTAVPTPETETELSEESEAERLEETIPSRGRKFIAI